MKRSRSDEFNEKTKLGASILWLLTKAYNNRVPPKFCKIFVTSQSGTYSIHPDLVTALTNGHVYCKACSNLFPDSGARWNDFPAVFTQLAERGFPVVDVHGSFIRAESLQTTVSFYPMFPKCAVSLKRLQDKNVVPEVHLYLIDTMMTARVADLVTIESVLKSIRSFSTTFLHAGNSMLQARTCEEALHLWLRCACRTGLKMASCGQMGDGGGGGDAVQDLASNLSDQQADHYTRQLAFATRLALLANFYAPDLLPFRTLHLGLHLSRNANVHNAHRFLDFAAANLASSPLHLSAEDLVRCARPPTAGPLRVNFNTMLAELFEQFEGQGSSFQPSCKVYFTYPVPRPTQPAEKLPEAGDASAGPRSFRLDDERDIYRERAESGSRDLTPRPSSGSPRRTRYDRSFSLNVSSTPASPAHVRRRTAPVSNSAPGHNALEALFSPPATPKRHGTFTKNSLEVMRAAHREQPAEVSRSGTFRLHKDGRRSTVRSILPEDDVRNGHAQEEDDEAYLTPTEDEPEDSRTTFARQLERRKSSSRHRSASTTSLPPVSSVSLTTRFNLRKSRRKEKKEEEDGRLTWAKLQRAPSLDGSPVASRKKRDDEESVASLPPSAEIQAALNRRKKSIERGKAEAMKEAERVLQKRSHLAFTAKVLQQEKKDVVASAAAEHDRLSAEVQKHLGITAASPDTEKPSRAQSRTPTRFEELLDGAGEFPEPRSRGQELQEPRSRGQELQDLLSGSPASTGRHTPCRSQDFLGVSPTMPEREDSGEGFNSGTFRLRRDEDLLETSSVASLPVRGEERMETMSCRSVPMPVRKERKEDLLEERVRVLQAEVDALKEHYTDARPSSPAPSVQSWPAWSAPDGEYAVSLDRLNTSLSDLQSEIARLSMQQERINRSLQSPASALNKVLTSSATSISGSSQSGRATWSQRTPVTEILPATSAPTPAAPVASPFVAPMPYFMAVPAQFSAPPWAGPQWPTTGPTSAPMDSPPAKPLSPDRLLPQREEDEDEEELETKAEDEGEEEEMPEKEEEREEEEEEEEVEEEEEQQSHLPVVEESPKTPPPAGLFFVELGEQERPEAEGAAAEPRGDGGMAATSFVVDANVQDDQENGEALQRRKQRLLAASARRRQQAGKKESVNSEAARRRAAERVREAKKQEDKIRRETIYQAYLERKNGGEVEEGPAAAYTPTTRPVSVRGGGARVRGPRAGVRGRGGLSKPNRAVSEERLHAQGQLTYQHRSQSSSAVSNGAESPAPALKLYVQPRVKSNRSVIINALTHCCLAGTVNQSMLELVVSELQVVEGSHFMILFRDSGCQFRSLYIFDTSSEECHRMTGVGPRRIKHSMVHSFYKYNSGSKKFTEITSTRHLSPVVDALTVFNKYWKKCPTCGGGVKNAQTRT